MDDFKEEFWDIVVEFGEPVLMATGLGEKARGELLDKMVRLRKEKQSAEAKSCKDSSTPKKRTDNKKVRVEIDEKSKINIIIIDIIILRLEKAKARVGRGRSG